MGGQAFAGSLAEMGSGSRWSRRRWQHPHGRVQLPCSGQPAGWGQGPRQDGERGPNRGGDNVWPLIKGWECWCGEVYLSL